MKQILFAFVFIFLIAMTGSKTITESTIAIDQMIEDWQRAKLYTQDYLDAMPEEGYGYKPTPEMRSFAQQYLHITAVNFRYVAAATGRENPYPGDSLELRADMQTKELVTNVTMASYDAAMEALKSLTEANLIESARLYRFDLTKEAIFKKGFEHQTHHRGQTTVYLRLKGVKPPFERLF
ncbi:MAG: DinB family protein [Bacteroidetes bacterium]|nr:DinB family protein [Bacteroidota bacterium]MDA1120457.1 DinB family protein [Bacteroidota bacterium]